MAGLLTRRALTVTTFRQPCRFKWCKSETEDKESTMKRASQESLYKDYDINSCKKVVNLCPITRLDCYKQAQKKPPRCTPKKKTTLTDALGKVIWVALKGGTVIAMFYFTIEAGLWKGSDQTSDLAKKMYKRLLEALGLDDSRMPTAAEVKYNAVQVWNKGVRIICNRIAHPLPDYEEYQAKRRSSQ